MPLAAQSKINTCIDGMDESLPIGLAIDKDIYFYEFTRIFKCVHIVNDNQEYDITFPRGIRENDILEQPMRCMIAANMTAGEKFGSMSPMNLIPVMGYFNEVPPHNMDAKKSTKPLQKGAINLAHINHAIFTSPLVGDIYNLDKIKVHFQKLPVRKFWGGVRNNTNQIYVWTEIPIVAGKYDVHTALQLQNTSGAIIINTVLGQGLAWYHQLRSMLLSGKCLVNVSRCSANIYVYLLAAACGCPVISLENEFIKEAFRDTAYFVKDAKEISRLDKGTIKKIGKKQHEMVMEDIVKKYDDIRTHWEDMFTKVSRATVC